MAVSTPVRKNNAVRFGAIAAAIVVVAAVVAAGLWWKERNEPSQASKADCAMAQKTVDEAQELPSDKAAVDKWAKSTAETRRSEMKDGYLGMRISTYEYWAAENAKGKGTPPSDKEVAELADKANEHCSDSGIELKFPPIAS
ncbi:hypothetical protein ACFFS2_23685 [Streptomyces aurantiacus]|uniref:Uncharacterized protein n=1 Tax=Streptomyces aurantiacus TaxID=47760 RepID=A0A7G1NXB2_9ACTN|nr:hypothetical protein [Streptomyces aurantiacus]BCL26360.1 hypothetical protein GCM10017557_12190 [Streptomyces aurantiacus]